MLEISRFRHISSLQTHVEDMLAIETDMSGSLIHTRVEGANAESSIVA